MTESLTEPVPKDLLEALWQLDGNRERAGWDQRPDLLALYEVRCATHGTTMAIAGMEVPGWPIAMGMTGHSFHAMHALAHALASTAPEVIRKFVPPSDLLGLVLIEEVWQVATTPGAPRPEGSLAGHPDRVEKRLTWLQLLDGRRAVLEHERDGVAQVIEHADQISGRISDALASLVQLIT